LLVYINCCFLEPLTNYFSIEVKESSKKKSYFFYFFKTIQDYNWDFLFSFIFYFFSNKPISGPYSVEKKNHFNL
jgi:hypothetical protein